MIRRHLFVLAGAAAAIALATPVLADPAASELRALVGPTDSSAVMKKACDLTAYLWRRGAGYNPYLISPAELRARGDDQAVIDFAIAHGLVFAVRRQDGEALMAVDADMTAYLNRRQTPP